MTGLSPNTQYAFRIRASYNARPYDRAVFLWPSGDKLFTHKTAGEIEWNNSSRVQKYDVFLLFKKNMNDSLKH